VPKDPPSDSEMTSEISFGDKEEPEMNIDRSKKVKKLNVSEYLKKCRHDEEYLRQYSKGRSGIGNYDTFCQCFQTGARGFAQTMANRGFNS
jgi:hypothetical protein